MNKIIGIPSNGPEIYDKISSHFGHCNFFIGVEILDDGSYKKVFALPSNRHSGCMEPVTNMKQRNVTYMILMSIGMRPFMGFQQEKIILIQGTDNSIENNLRLLIDGQLKP